MSWRSRPRSSPLADDLRHPERRLRGQGAGHFAKPGALWAYACGVALLIAVASLFKGLSLGPASVVAPVYGMFIIGGAVLGVIVLGEPVAAKKVAGLALCVAGVCLVAS